LRIYRQVFGLEIVTLERINTDILIRDTFEV